MTITNCEYQYDIVCPSTIDLEKLWLDLEGRAESNFFLSWYWVKAWLSTFAPTCKLALIRTNSELIGIGLLTFQVEVRHRLLRSRVIRIGRTGQQKQDQIWIEYNGLLIDQRHKTSLPPAFMNFLLKKSDWDEFELGATPVEQQQLYQVAGCTPVIKWSSPTFGVNLNTLRSEGRDYLASLSRNARHQINRSKRLYESRGQLVFRTTSTLAEIQLIWPELARLHQERWNHTEEGSGFANAEFVTFHQNLLHHGCPDGAIEFCTLTLDTKLIGCLYNFIYRGKVYFYLSGLQYEDDPRLKPGMLLHALAIQQYLERGLQYYDFLGGAARYKESLGTRGSDLQLISYQRPRLKLKLERFARRLKSVAIRHNDD